MTMIGPSKIDNVSSTKEGDAAMMGNGKGTRINAVAVQSYIAYVCTQDTPDVRICKYGYNTPKKWLILAVLYLEILRNCLLLHTIFTLLLICN